MTEAIVANVEELVEASNARHYIKPIDELEAEARAIVLHGLKLAAYAVRRRLAAEDGHGRVEPLTPPDVKHLESRRDAVIATVDPDRMLDIADDAIGRIAGQYHDWRLVQQIGRELLSEYEHRLSEAR